MNMQHFHDHLNSIKLYVQFTVEGSDGRRAFLDVQPRRDDDGTCSQYLGVPQSQSHQTACITSNRTLSISNQTHLITSVCAICHLCYPILFGSISFEQGFHWQCQNPVL